MKRWYLLKDEDVMLLDRGLALLRRHFQDNQPDRDRMNEALKRVEKIGEKLQVESAWERWELETKVYPSREGSA